MQKTFCEGIFTEIAALCGCPFMGEKGGVKVSKCQSVFLMFFKNACILKKHIIYIILFKRKKNTRKKK